MSQSFVSLSFIQYNQNKWWAFKQMRLMPPKIEQVAGAQFIKLLGTGSGTGFSLWPDFSTYALLIKWDSQAAADRFHKENQLFHAFISKATAIKTYHLSPIASHGAWDGANPFEVERPISIGRERLAVITRARINWNRLIHFWRYVPKTSKAIRKAEGLHSTKGVGEWPLIEQATFSIWQDEKAMKNYAYQDIHKTVIKKVQQQNWYKEELFARFRILKELTHL